MTRIHRIFVFAAVLAAVTAPSARAALDDQDTVYAYLSVAGSASLSIQPKNVSDNANASNMSFNLPAPGETLTLSNQYMEVSFNTNFDNWKIKTRTNSGQTPDGANFWGALVGSDTNYKVYLRWKAADVHALPSLTSGNWGSWTLYKDPADPDYDYNSNYINVANGGSWDGGWAQMADGSPCTSPIFVYVAGNTPGAPPGTYQNQLYFDLIHL